MVSRQHQIQEQCSSCSCQMCPSWQIFYFPLNQKVLILLLLTCHGSSLFLLKQHEYPWLYSSLKSYIYYSVCIIIQGAILSIIYLWIWTSRALRWWLCFVVDTHKCKAVREHAGKCEWQFISWSYYIYCLEVYIINFIVYSNHVFLWMPHSIITAFLWCDLIHC